MIVYWDNQELMPLFLLISVFGVAAAFNMVFIANAELMPTLLSASGFGLANLVARGFGVLAPQAAEMDFPTPEIIFLALLVIGIVTAQLINTNRPRFI